MRPKIISAVWWSATRTGGQAFVSFVVFLTLVRLLDPKSFGLVAMATLFTEFILMFQDQGFDQAIVQRQDLDDTHLDTAFWVSLVTGCFLTGGGMVLAGLIARLFGEPDLESIVRWLSLSFIMLSFGSTQSAIMRRSLKMKQLALRSLSATTVSGIVAIGLALSGFGVWSLVARGLVATFLESLLVWFLSDWRPRFRFCRRQFIELFIFGANIVGKRVVTIVHHRCDTFLIGFFLGPTLLGYYTVAHKLIFMIKKTLTGIPGSVALPAFSRMQQEPDRLRRAFFEATRLTSAIAFPVFLGIASVGSVLVPVLYGEQWTQSVPIVQLLALIGILQAIFYYHGTAMVAAGKPFWNLGVNLVTMVCNIIALVIAVRWGIVAVAAACVVSSYLAAPASLLAVRHVVQFKLGSYLRQCVVPLVASLAMVTVVYGLQQLTVPIHVYSQLSFMVVIGAMIYLVVLQVTAPSLIAQIIELIRMLRPRPNAT